MPWWEKIDDFSTGQKDEYLLLSGLILWKDWNSCDLKGSAATIMLVGHKNLMELLIVFKAEVERPALDFVVK